MGTLKMGLVGSSSVGRRHHHREWVVGECTGLHRIHEVVVAGAIVGRRRIDAAAARVADATVTTTLVDRIHQGRTLVVAELRRIAERSQVFAKTRWH